MCGLAGGYWSRYSGEIEGRVKESLNKIQNRGPDDSGYKFIEVDSSIVVLGHTRLSIIDLSLAGHQPMSSDDGRYSLVFNGEIYNYLELKHELTECGVCFKTKSDTEVLLQAWSYWGVDCLLKLNGMFAFVVYDHIEKILFCARDPFGIKPFYYELADDGFVFSSELPSLLSLRDKKAKPNLQRSYDYLVFGEYDSNEETFIEGVKQLKPAQYLTIKVGDANSLLIKTWWNPENILPCKIPFEKAVSLVREQFLNNVKLQLRSDVPLGVALSGGVDSSAVVCAMRKIAPETEIHTFSYIADGELSEEVWVDRVNDFVGAQSHKVVATGEDLARDLDAMISAQGEPFGSTSIYAQYRVFQLVKSAGITVSLDGQGADELLAGYDGYPGYRIKSLVETGKLLAAYKFINNWRKWPNRSIGFAAMHLGRVVLPEHIYNFFRRRMDRKATPDWLNVDYFLRGNVVANENRLVPKIKRKGSSVTSYLQYALGKRSLPALLRHADRNAMNFSVESRVPFLSIPLAVFLLSLPENYLISDKGETKYVFREAMRGIMPDDVLKRKDKVGFTTPEKNWVLEMAADMRVWLAASENIPFLNSEMLLREFDKQCSDGKINARIWRLLNYCRWYELYISD